MNIYEARQHLRDGIERLRVDDEAREYVRLCERGVPLAEVEQRLVTFRADWERNAQQLIDEWTRMFAEELFRRS